MVNIISQFSVFSDLSHIYVVPNFLMLRSKAKKFGLGI